MKKIFILLVAAVGVQIVHAQGLGSFFNQKKTQKKYYLQQIAALQLQLGYLKQGYRAAGSGLKTISGYKNSEYGSHNKYYKQLAQVNPGIEQSEAVKEIHRNATAIRTVFETTIEQVAKEKVMTEKEMNYIRKVYGNLDSKLKQDMEELGMIITPGKLKLSDDERWKKVKEIQVAVANKYAFSLSFNKKAVFISRQRQRELKDIDRLKKIHNIKQ